MKTNLTNKQSLIRKVSNDYDSGKMSEDQANGENPCKSPIDDIIEIPCDWNVKSKSYNLKCCHIWAEYWKFVQVFNEKQMVDGSQ